MQIVCDGLLSGTDLLISSLGSKPAFFAVVVWCVKLCMSKYTRHLGNESRKRLQRI